MLVSYCKITQHHNSDVLGFNGHKYITKWDKSPGPKDHRTGIRTTEYNGTQQRSSTKEKTGSPGN
jgi:hypothetical protein